MDTDLFLRIVSPLRLAMTALWVGVSISCQEADPVSPVDEKPLQFAVNLPALGSVTQRAAVLSVKVNSVSTGYFVVQQVGIDEPGAAQIKAGQDGKGEEAQDSGTMVLEAETLKIIPLVLTPYVDNEIHLLVENEKGETLKWKLSIVNKLSTIKALTGTFSNFYSVVVSQDDSIILEEYYNGRTASNLNDGRSLAKGITSLLVGKAIELGYFTLDSKLGDHLPAQYLAGLSDSKKDVTVEQLLTMSSGLGGLESEFAQWIQVPDEIVVVLERDLVSEPGVVWNYSTPNVQMLSVIFQEATGKSLEAFGKEYFFEPMQMDTTAWAIFETGYTLAGSLIFLTTRDYLKIGEMVMNNGAYKGTQIMNDEYLQEMVQQRFPVPPNYGGSISTTGFGYLWWAVTSGSVSGYMTAGYGGQYIAVFPTLKLVIAINSKANVNLTLAQPQSIRATSLIAGIVEAVR